MDSVLFDILFFLIAIGVLVSVHEFGHFWVARTLGVKVLRFSIGFGRPLWRRTSARDGTEYVLAALPFGGYVKMLDEREEHVAAHELHRAFNRQPLWIRSAVVTAGPAANFLFAILAFWLVLMLGETGMRPLIGQVTPNTPAAHAGFHVGDQIVSVDGRATPTWSLAIQELAADSIGDLPLDVQVRDAAGQVRHHFLPPGALGDMTDDPNLLSRLGVEPAEPPLPAVIGKVLPGERAAQAGLKAGDRVLTADGTPIHGWKAWVEYVRARPGKPIALKLQRGQHTLELTVTPKRVTEGGKSMGRIGAEVDLPKGIFDKYRAVYRLGPLAAAVGAVGRTYEYSALTLKVIWRILVGEASIRNLSGPFSIADAAGKSASYGLVAFLKFLAVVSISLGVLNLLPVPVLDGGHLLYFAAEGVRGRPLPESWLETGQKLGILLLAGLMALAFYVDFQRFFG